MKRRRDGEMERRRDGEIEGGRDRERGRLREILSLCLSVSLSLCLPVSLSLCLSALLWVDPLIAEAQTGAITGRVITEDGGGLANVTVMLLPVNLNQKGYTRQFSTIT